jgi:hypothetical protein
MKDSLLGYNARGLLEVGRRTMMMEATRTSETSVYFNGTTRCCIPEAVIFILAAVRTRNLTSMNVESRCAHVQSLNELCQPVKSSFGLRACIHHSEPLSPFHVWRGTCVQSSKQGRAPVALFSGAMQTRDVPSPNGGTTVVICLRAQPCVALRLTSAMGSVELRHVVAYRS